MKLLRVTPFFLGMLIFFSCFDAFAQCEDKIDGVCLMPVWDNLNQEYALPIDELGAEWISIVTYIYGYTDLPNLDYKKKRKQFSDTEAGRNEIIKLARLQDLKIMIKPSVWIPGYGWPGDFNLQKEADWKQWEKNYRAYILDLASWAEREKVELFSLGTEYKKAIKVRPEFWLALIQEIKEIYSGQLTYCSNWDNFKNIPFWDQLDYIGVDAYFPLSDKETPSVEELIQAWSGPLKSLSSFSEKMNKPILFTEFGYKSLNQAMWKQWEIEFLEGFHPTNFESQSNGYQALFEVFWEEEWFAGGFIWHWLHDHKQAGGTTDNDYSPQNKPSQKLIQSWYLNY